MATPPSHGKSRLPGPPETFSLKEHVALEGRNFPTVSEPPQRPAGPVGLSSADGDEPDDVKGLLTIAGSRADGDDGAAVAGIPTEAASAGPTGLPGVGGLFGALAAFATLPEGTSARTGPVSDGGGDEAVTEGSDLATDSA